MIQASSATRIVSKTIGRKDPPSNIQSYAVYASTLAQLVRPPTACALIAMRPSRIAKQYTQVQ